MTDSQQDHQSEPGPAAPRLSLPGAIRRWALKRIFPSIYLHENPFRIVEYRRLLGLTKITKNDVVLDVGCGIGTVTCCLAPLAKHTVGIDIDAATVTLARQLAQRLGGQLNVSYQNTTIEQAAFPEGSFDKIVCLAVLSAVPAYEAVLAASCRALKSGGELLATFDSLEAITDATLVQRHFREHKIAQYFRPESVRSALRQAGFEKVEIHSLFSGRIAQRYFADAVRNNFALSRAAVLTRAVILRMTERLAPAERPGIRLLVRAVK